MIIERFFANSFVITVSAYNDIITTYMGGELFVQVYWTYIGNA